MPAEAPRYGNMNLNFVNRQVPERSPRLMEYPGSSIYDRMPAAREERDLLDHKENTYGGTDIFVKFMWDVSTILAGAVGLENPVDSAHESVAELRQIENLNSVLAKLPRTEFVIVVTKDDDEHVAFYHHLSDAMRDPDVASGKEGVRVDLLWGRNDNDLKYCKKDKDDDSGTGRPYLTPPFRAQSIFDLESKLDRCPKSFDAPGKIPPSEKSNVKDDDGGDDD
jgi:hypothetical protein